MTPLSTDLLPLPASDIAAGRVAVLENELAKALTRIRYMEMLLREQYIRMFGPKSEKLSDLTLALLTMESGVTADEVDAEALREPLVAEPEGEAPRRKKHPGRRPLSAHLPRVIETLVCPPEACRCQSCGAETVVIGHDESERLDKEPAKFFVRVTRREKRACRSCQQATVTAAPLPERIVEKSLAADGLIVDVLVNKYCDHLPLYRQQAILLREAGVEISRSTMDGWVMQVGGNLDPVVMAMRAELLASAYLQADETKVPVQMHDQRGSNFEAYLWQYGQPEGPVVFEFSLTRAAEVPTRFLNGFSGILQTDGYQAYDGIGGGRIIHLGCWAHARRMFVDAVKVSPEDAEAVAMVTRMDALFLIDRSARQDGLSREARQARRDELSPQLVEGIHTACTRLAAAVLPASALGKAVRYTLNQWEKLKRCVAHPEAELSNNLAENSMRPVVLGRKNWLHVGSVDAGPKVAAILSVIESCRRMKLPVRDYLAAVLPGLENRTLRQVKELTPVRWALGRR